MSRWSGTGTAWCWRGWTNPNGYADQKTAEELYGEIQREAGDLCTILLAHRNDRFDQYAAAGYDLVISGHAHGGIVRLPFTDGLLARTGSCSPPGRRGFIPWETAPYSSPGDWATIRCLFTAFASLTGLIWRCWS